MKERKKKDKLLIFGLIGGLVLIVGTIIGLSYAYWTYTTTQETINTLTTGCLQIEMEDITAAVNLQKAYPISDEEGANLEPYTFKITNTCSQVAYFDVNLEILDVEERLSSEYVAVSLNGTVNSTLADNPEVNTTYAKDDYTAVEAYNLASSKLAGGESKSYALRLWMDESVTTENDAMNKNFISKISITASVTGESAICRRATSLHTETCSQTATSYYCGRDGYVEGDTITYGSLGTSGTLTTGDAFDCDVNGDGIYNVESERFYYVSDYYDTSTNEYNSEYSTLIYYNNVTSGLPDNTATYAYYADSSSNAYGPATALLQLPTTTQWSNVSLYTTTRNVQYETGIIRKSGFSYSGYASRLLTYQEVYKGCYDGTTEIGSAGGLSSKCKFLFENSKYSSPDLKYGYWLENAHSSYSGNALLVYGSNSLVNDLGVTSATSDGVRPAIEVNKNDIKY